MIACLSICPITARTEATAKDQSLWIKGEIVSEAQSIMVESEGEYRTLLKSTPISRITLTRRAVRLHAGTMHFPLVTCCRHTTPCPIHGMDILRLEKPILRRENTITLREMVFLVGGTSTFHHEGKRSTDETAFLTSEVDMMMGGEMLLHMIADEAEVREAEIGIDLP